MRQSILQRVRITYVISLALVFAALVIVGVFGIAGKEGASKARDRHAQSFYALADALAIVQEATSQGFVAMASKVPADVKQYIIDQQQYLSSFDRAIGASLQAQATPEKRRTLERIKDGFAAYLAAVRKSAEEASVDPAFHQHLKETHRQLVASLQMELDNEREAMEQSLAGTQENLNRIQSSLIAAGVLFSVLCVVCYFALFHTPLKREASRFALHVEHLTTSDNSSDSRHLQSPNEFTPILNALGDAFLFLKDVVRRVQNLTAQGHSLLNEAQRTIGTVSDLAAAEGMKHRTMTDNMEKEFEARQRRQQKVSEISTTIAETSQAVASIKQRMDALRESILSISTSADENLHQLSGIDQQTTEVSDSTSNIRKNIEAISREIKEMSENAAERSRVLADLDTLLGALKENVLKTKANQDEIDQRSENRTQLLDETRNQASATKSDLEAISDSMKTVEKKIAELEEKIKHTDEVIDKVNEIARKTNILALNAQVEAAKAKEGGEGFKVIADEIKLLAGTATESTSDIGKVFDEIRESINAVKDAMQDEKEKILTSQNQSTKTIEGLERIQNMFAGITALRSQTKQALDNAAAESNDASMMTKKVLQKSSEVTSSLHAQTQQLEAINAELQDLDQITTHVSNGTAEVRKVIETQIVESIKRVSAEIAEIGEAIAQQDSATDMADAALKDMKAEYRMADEYESAVRETKKELDKLFEKEEEQLMHLTKTLEQAYKITEEQTSLLAVPVGGARRMYSGLELHGNGA